jgi:hypothetical protein
MRHLLGGLLAGSQSSQISHLSRSELLGQFEETAGPCPEHARLGVYGKKWKAAEQLLSQ